MDEISDLGLITGLVSEKTDSRDALASDFMGESEGVIPDYFELPAPGPTHHQKHPSCVGEAESGVTESANKLEENQYTKMSSRYIYAHCKAIDGYSGLGTFINTAIEVARTKGCVSEADYPYTEDYNDFIQLPSASIDKIAERYRIKGYVRFSTNDINLIKRYLMEYKTPVRTGSSGTNATWNRTAVKNNNYIIPEYVNKSWNHAIKIVGWNDNGWIIENSWGDDWGVIGRATLPHDYKGIFNSAYASYDLPNYWKEINNMWNQLETIEAAWKWLEELGHPPINDVDRGIHMKAKTPEEFYRGLLSYVKQWKSDNGID